MLLINTFAISLSLVGSALAEYGSGSTPNYGSGAGDSSSVVAPSASTSSSLTAMRSASASGSSCSGGSTSVHVVRVSNKSGNLVYEPNDIKAAVGTMVQFQFYPKNHSVVQSTFDQPCQPINNIMPNVPGFFSGFMPVAAKASTMPAWTVMINDTKPIWFYCSQGKHCQAGMVGVINAPAANQSRTITAFQGLAKQAPANVSPGQSTSGTAASGTISTSPTTSGGSNTSSPSAASVAVTNGASSGIFAAGGKTRMSIGTAGFVAAAIMLML